MRLFKNNDIDDLLSFKYQRNKNIPISGSVSEKISMEQENFDFWCTQSWISRLEKDII